MSLNTICLFAHTFPLNKQDVRGGFVRDLAIELSRRGHEIHVVTPMRPGTPNNELVDGVYVHRFIYWGWRKDELLGQLRGTPILLLGSLLAAGIVGCLMTVLKYNIKIIHAYWVVPGGLVATICGRFTKRPVVVTAAGSDLELAVRRNLIQILVRFTLRHLDRLIPVSTNLQRLALSLGIPKHKVSVIHGPVGINLAALSQSTPALPEKRACSQCLLYVGALAPPRRLDTIVRAMGRIREAFPDCHLVIVGDGSLRPPAEALVDELSMHTHVHFLGTLSHDRVFGLLQNADIFIHCSNQEGLGIAIMEAMGAALPVVASRVGGVPDLVREGKTGFMISADDVEGYAEKILLLLNDDDLRKRLGAKGRRFAESRLDKKKILSQLEAVYNELLN